MRPRRPHHLGQRLRAQHRRRGRHRRHRRRAGHRPPGPGDAGRRADQNGAAPAGDDAPAPGDLARGPAGRNQLRPARPLRPRPHRLLPGVSKSNTSAPSSTRPPAGSTRASTSPGPGRSRRSATPKSSDRRARLARRRRRPLQAAERVAGRADHLRLRGNRRPRCTPGSTSPPASRSATFVPGGSIEMGFADASGIPLSHGEYQEGDETVWGHKMAAFLTSIGGAQRPHPGPQPALAGQVEPADEAPRADREPDGPDRPSKYSLPGRQGQAERRATASPAAPPAATEPGESGSSGPALRIRAVRVRRHARRRRRALPGARRGRQRGERAGRRNARRAGASVAPAPPPAPGGGRRAAGDAAAGPRHRGARLRAVRRPSTTPPAGWTRRPRPRTRSTRWSPTASAS